MFKLIAFVIKYLPVIISAVSMVEGLVSKDTPGADKKALVMATLKQFLSAAGVSLSPQVESIISQVIDIAVTILNALGIFKRKDERGEEDEPAPVSAQAVTPAVVKQAVARVESENEARLAELEAILTRE